MIDVQVVGELEKKSPSPLLDHFIVLYVDEKEVLKSDVVSRDPAPRWTMEKPL